MKYSLLFLHIICAVCIVYAKDIPQYTEYDNRIPGIIKSYKPAYDDLYPDWAKKLYIYPVNVYEIEKEFEAYISKNPGKHNAIIRYYKQWIRAIAPYTDNIGTIHIPVEKISINKSMFSSEQTLSNKANWQFWGPKETVWLNENGNTAPCPWQANIYSFDVSTSNNDILYCGTETGYVNKTTDKGVNWQIQAKDYYFGGGIIAIAIHPTNPLITYVSAGNQIHKTIDGGKNWTKQLSTQFSTDRLKVDPIKPNTVFAASPSGLFRTTDAGSTWTKVWSGKTYDIEIKPANTQYIYALSEQSNGNFTVIQSNDGGITFNPQMDFPQNIPSKSGGLLSIRLSPVNLTALYVIMLSSDEIPLLYKGFCTETSSAWTKLATGKTTALPMDNWQGYYDLVLEVSPKDSNIIYTGTASLFKSTNNGSTFSIVGGYGGKIPVHPDQQDMKIMPNGDTWISTDGGLTLSTDNFVNTANAKSLNNGIVGSDFWGFDQSWNEDLTVAGRYHNGNTAIADFYNPKALRMGGAESPTGWVLNEKDRHVAFNDLGDGWILPKTATDMPEGRFTFTKFPNMEEYGGRRSNLVHHPFYSAHLFVGEGNGFWKSTDRGITWNLLYDFGKTVRYFTMSSKNPSIIYADIAGLGLHKSTDGGKTWQAKGSLYQSPNANANWKGLIHISLSPFNDQVLYVCLSNGTWSADIGKIFKSIDGGDSWTDITSGLNEYMKCTVVQPSDGEDLIYLFTIARQNTSAKVYYRKASQTNWTLFSDNYPAGMVVNAALPFYRDGKLRVGGNGGVWETLLADTSFTPIVQPWVPVQKLGCYTDTVQFNDHSIAIESHIKRTWNISPAPLWIDDIHIRNPKVVFGKPGNYDISLSLQQNGAEYENLIPNMVTALDCPSITTCNNPDFIPKKDWSLLYYDSEEIYDPGLAKMSFDDDPSTIWHTRWSTGTDSLPHEIHFDLGQEYRLFTFAYKGRAEGSNGRVKDFELYLSNDTLDWGKPVYTGSFQNVSAPQTITLDSNGINARFMRFKALSEINGNPWTTVAEFYLKGCIPPVNSIKDEIIQDEFPVFPVPISHSFTMSLPFGQHFTCRIFSVDGSLKQESTFEKSSDSFSTDISSLQQGIYLIQLINEHGSVYKSRIIISR